MVIRIDRKAKQALYKQIVEQMRQQILSGAMPVGYRLPPERQLAAAIGVNRTTVLTAYRELKSDGFVTSHVGRGTVVSLAPLAEQSQAQPSASHEPLWEHLFSDASLAMNNGAIEHILQCITRKDTISFAGGFSSLDPRPDAAIRGFEEELLADTRNKALLVSPVEGFYSLRQCMAAFMHVRGCFCLPEEIMMVSGAQQAIDILARSLLNPGDTVLIEEPSYFPAMHAFKAAGARLMGIPMTAEGMDLNILEHLLQRCKPKLIYTMPTFQNPSGASLPMEARVRLLELANKHQTVIVEDDPYSELRYDGETLPSLKSMDSRGFVIYCGTFSKTVAPGLRLGWICGQRRLLRTLVAAKQFMDVHTSSLSQCIMERFLTGGGFDSYLGTVSKGNKERRDAMVAALERHAPYGLRWNRPAGGSYLWCGLPPGVTATHVFNAAASAGVAILPGPLFTLSPHTGEQYIRLNFTYESLEAIRKGIRLLCREIARLCEEHTEPQGQEVIYDVNPLD